jgi:hypothetical protein
VDLVRCIGAIKVTTKDSGVMEFKMGKGGYLFLGKVRKEVNLKIMCW